MLTQKIIQIIKELLLVNIILVLIAKKTPSLKFYNSNYIEQLAMPLLYVKSEPNYTGTSEMG